MDERKESILKELKEKFEETKKDLGFKADFETLDERFFIKDSVLGAGFVSENFSRQLCSRIVETYNNWINYLHSLIMPNPGFLINLHESKMVDESDRKDITKLMSRVLAFTSMNSVIGLVKDKGKEARFIDESVRFWDEEFKPVAETIVKKINGKWNEK